MNTNPLDTKSLETGVIGSILIDTIHSIPVVMDQLGASDFGDPVLRHIFEAIWQLYTELQPIDPVTVAARAGAAMRSTVLPGKNLPFRGRGMTSRTSSTVKRRPR